MAIDAEYFRKKLTALRDELTVQSERSSDARKPVMLDQQSVGRLSRQDAIQQQAMAKAQDARRAVQLRRIDAALARLDEGEFGYCAECGEAIALKRLDIDPTTAYCAACADALRR